MALEIVPSLAKVKVDGSNAFARSNFITIKSNAYYEAAPTGARTFICRETGRKPFWFG